MGNSFAGDKLKQLRQSLGWSQIDLAERIGVSGSMVSMYEGGQREPARETLMKIANELKVSMDDLVQRDDGNTPVASFNPLKNESTDFGFTISRSRRNGGMSVCFFFDNKKPALEINGRRDEFGAAYERLQPEDKIAVCKEMFRRAKEELINGM